jgi:hypothetical protein
MEPKDLLVVLAGVIGCVTGVYALVRQLRLDRMVYWEPYFNKKWKQIGGPLRDNVNTTEHWLTGLEKELSKYELPDLTLEGSVPPPYHKIDWTYDRRLEKHLESYTSALDNLREQVRHYRELASLLNPETYIKLQLRNVFPGKFSVPEGTAETQREEKQRVINLIKFYSGDIEISLQDLKANRHLAADIQRSKTAIEFSIATVRSYLGNIECAIDFYDTKFSSY